MQTSSSGFVRKSLAVFSKDVKSELRTRYAMNAIGMFAIMTVFAVSLAFKGIRLESTLQASLLWIVIYFSSLSGLAQSFIKEEESKTAMALRLYASPGAVFGGKLIFNIGLLMAMNALTIPLFAVFIGLEIGSLALFLVMVVIGSVGMAGTTTLVAAIISRAYMKGALFAVLSFPLVLPLLVMSISGTEKSLAPGAPLSAARMEIQVLLSYLVVMTVLGFILFDSVWND